MKTIGIIFAMNEELSALKKYLSLQKVNKIYELTFYETELNNKRIILVESGVGKVNAARTTQILIDNYHPNVVYNIGVAGGVDNSLEVGDIVVSTSLVQHDFDITAFNHPKGYISNIGQFIESDIELIKKLEKTITYLDNKDFNITIGTIATGDIFCTDINMKNKIRTKFNAEAIEMEGAAIAQVCKLDNIPFVIIRSISDKPNGKNEITFDEFLKKASKRCAYIIEKFFETL